MAFLPAWAEFQHRADAYEAVDNERVLVLAHFGGHGKTSGLEIGQIGTRAALFHVRRDKVTRIVIYFDRNRALSDLGRKE